MSLQLGPASKVAPIDKLSVAITIVLSILLLKEQLSWSLIIGGAIIIGGSLIIAIFQLQSSIRNSAHGNQNLKN